jgi:hypothetical protein
VEFEKKNNKKTAFHLKETLNSAGFSSDQFLLDIETT